MKMNATSSDIWEQIHHPTRCNDPAGYHLIKTRSKGRKSCILGHIYISRIFQHEQPSIWILQ